jgi:acyl-CoA dehydrogenase
MTSLTREDLKDIQELARSVAVGRIAPYAADVDDKARFPTEGYRALVDSQLHALVIPEHYGGVGADAITAAVVGEEIARVCATTNQVAGANEHLPKGRPEVDANKLPDIQRTAD